MILGLNRVLGRVVISCTGRFSLLRSQECSLSPVRRAAFPLRMIARRQPASVHRIVALRYCSASGSLAYRR